MGKEEEVLQVLFGEKKISTSFSFLYYSLFSLFPSPLPGIIWIEINFTFIWTQ